jgi:hypothetical protein
MDKKQLTELLDGIIAEVKDKHDLSEVEARTMIGIALRKNRTAFLSAVVTPTLVLASPIVS